MYVKVVTVCIAFVITQLEIRVYAGSEYIEGEGDKIPFAFLSEGLLDCYFAEMLIVPDDRKVEEDAKIPSLG